MPTPTLILDYLAQAAALGGSHEVSFCEGSTCWEIPHDVLRAGVLDLEQTRTIHSEYTRMHPDVPYGRDRVPLLVSIRTLMPTVGEGRRSLLLLPAMLDASGSLGLAEGARAWIPLDFLSAEAMDAPEFSVCDIDTYRAHQIALANLPNDGSWITSFDRAEDLYATVTDLDEEFLARHGAHVESAHCYVRIWETPDPVLSARDWLEHTSRAIAEKSVDVLSGPLRTLLDCNDSNQDVDEAGGFADDELLDLKLVCGIPECASHLTNDQRAALVSFAHQSKGDVQALVTPLGTPARQIALAAMANNLTECALRGDDVPKMAYVASEADLERVARELIPKAPASQTSLATRWLPRIATSSAASSFDTAQTRVLGPLPYLTIAHIPTEAEESDRELGLLQPPAYPLDGDAARYADPWYVPQATTHFLDCSARLLGERQHDAMSASERLSERLRLVDQDRCELIDAYAEVCRGTEHMRERDQLMQRLTVLRKSHRVTRERLAFWEAEARKNPPRRPLIGRAVQSQVALIATRARSDEYLVEGCELLEDVCANYLEELERIESEIDHLRGSSADLARRVRAASPEGQRCSRIIQRLQESCALNREQSALLDSVIDGDPEVSLARLDDVLDQTVRPAEFWLAVHIYEGRWLAACADEETRSGAIAATGIVGLQARAGLCPISLVPDHYAISLCADASDGMTQAFDLMVLGNARTLSLPEATVIIGLSSRAIVLGSEGDLGARPLYAAASDQLRCAATMGEEAWNDLVQAGWTVSGGESALSLLQKRDATHVDVLNSIDAPYGELCDLRGDLVPTERLRTHRIPANGADDAHYALSRMVPPVSYVLVPDSSWEQVGGSRRNHAEAQAIGRWLGARTLRIAKRYGAESDDAACVMAVLTPHEAQRDLIKEVLANVLPAESPRVEVHTVREAREHSWPLVVLSATCGPESFAPTTGFGTAHVLGTAAASATDALVLFCGGVWMTSADLGARAIMGRGLRMGKLFSAARTTRKVRLQTQGSPQEQEQILAAGLSLRGKPVSLTSFLHRLLQSGDITEQPPAAEVNKALEGNGLIERHKNAEGHVGWRPTAAGREIGILATQDHAGNPFCAYTPTASHVVASIVDALLAEKSAEAEGE